MTFRDGGFVERGAELKRLIGDLRLECGSLKTNAPMFWTSQAGSPGQEPLKYELHDGALLFFCDEGLYERLIYFVSDAGCLPMMNRVKSILIEEPLSDQSWSSILFSRLEELGWCRVANNLQVSMSLDARGPEVSCGLSAAEERLRGKNMQIVECSADMVPEVLDLWSSLLKPTDVPMNHRNFLQDPTQKAACVVDGGGAVCGANWWKTDGRSCEIRHTVTAPDRHRCGVAYAMVLAALSSAIEEGCKSAFTYIDELNSRSLGLYGKVGMLPNGKVAVQYLLKG